MHAKEVIQWYLTPFCAMQAAAVQHLWAASGAKRSAAERNAPTSASASCSSPAACTAPATAAYTSARAATASTAAAQSATRRREQRCRKRHPIHQAGVRGQGRLLQGDLPLLTVWNISSQACGCKQHGCKCEEMIVRICPSYALLGLCPLHLWPDLMDHQQRVTTFFQRTLLQI